MLDERTCLVIKVMSFQIMLSDFVHMIKKKKIKEDKKWGNGKFIIISIFVIIELFLLFFKVI